LQRLLDDARTYQEACARRHPEDKPLFVDGSLFTSLFVRAVDTSSTTSWYPGQVRSITAVVSPRRSVGEKTREARTPGF
jgi:hypothetical protein